MKQYDTLLDALNDLKERGFTYDFNLQENCIACRKHDMILRPDEFHIVEVHRFEGMTDPEDSAILYAIESNDGKKGVLVNAYGAYSDSMSAEMVEKLSVPHL